MINKLLIDDSWKDFFAQEQEKTYFFPLLDNIKSEYQNYHCFPEWANIFAAFNVTKLSQVKVVILGQDPYHQPNQAHGLAFSVTKETKIPPSLQNIYQELNNDLQIKNEKHGYLLKWAQQGVFLLNTTLSVRHNQANSHSKYDWNIFTDNVLSYLNSHKEHLVFILWGNNAKQKRNLIDSKKHLILESVHPSPLSAYGGFFGSKPFSKTNQWLTAHNEPTIDWQLD